MKATRNTLIIALAAGALLALSPALRAEDTKEAKPAPKADGKRGDMMKQRMEDLKLTDEQKKKVEEVFKAQREKMKDLSPEERREKMREGRQEMDKKLKEILTKEQYEKWEKDRPQGGPGAGGPGKKRGEKKAEKN